jgi:hypothetical protein
MLIVTACVAVICSVVFRTPDWIGHLALLFVILLIPAILATLLVYGNRGQRTFSIGALFPSGFMLLTALGFCDIQMVDFDDMLPISNVHNYRLSVVLFLLFGALNGYLCVLTRRWIEKGRETEKGETPTDTEFRA